MNGQSVVDRSVTKINIMLTYKPVPFELFAFSSEITSFSCPLSIKEGGVYLEGTHESLADLRICVKVVLSRRHLDYYKYNMRCGL